MGARPTQPVHLRDPARHRPHLHQRVGQHTWEEINDGIAGSNYGWPATEGPTADPSFRSPVFAYGHGASPTTGCAIAGGAFYNPATAQFPSDFVGDYFFSDLFSGWIRRLDPVSGIVTDFVTGISVPVDVQVGADGSLYFLSRGDGAVHAIRYTGGSKDHVIGHSQNWTDDSKHRRRFRSRSRFCLPACGGCYGRLLTSRVTNPLRRASGRAILAAKRRHARPSPPPRLSTALTEQ